MNEKDRLCAALGYVFNDASFLVRALTHRSHAHEASQRGADNERLEFLGDAVLGLATSALLSELLPTAKEGELTKRRAEIVRESSLAQIARDIGIRDALLLGRGEERSGGRDKPRLLASALEACIGAIFLDRGFDAAFAVLRTLLEPRLNDFTAQATDYKSRLQERTQAEGQKTPRYEMLEVTGPDHERRFTVAILVEDVVAGKGEGRTKLEAEQAAARAAWEAFETQDAEASAAGLLPIR